MGFRLKRWFWEWGYYPSMHIHRDTEVRTVETLDVYGLPNPWLRIVEVCRVCRWVR